MTIDIPQQPVVSSNIRSFGYDVERKILAVTFKGGDLWHYLSVPFALVEQFSEAESKGRFYQQHIKSKFTADKLTGLCPQCSRSGRIGVACECGGEGAVYARDPR